MKNIPHLSLSKILFIVFFVVYLVSSWYITSYLNVYFNDTVSRTANAFFTVFGRNPHLAAIGFVWLPLPSMMQIPLILILHSFGLHMLSAPIITSFLGALSVVMIYKISLQLNGNKKSFFSILVASLYGFNPMILLYVSIGSSEIIFISSVIIFSFYFLRWYLKQGILDLVLSAFFVVMAFGSRYEAIPVFISGIVLVIIIELSKKSPFKKTQALLMLFSIPFLYVFCLWVLLNWLIMGDPLYFINGPYSNSSYTYALSQNSSLLENSYKSIYHSSLYAIKRILFLWPGFILAPLVLLQFNKNRKQSIDNMILLLVLLFPYFSILVFHIFQLYEGQSFGWLRFFIYSIVSATLMALYFINKHKIFKYLISALLLLGFFTTIYAMGNYNYGKEEKSFVIKIENKDENLEFSRTYSDQKAVASFMDTKDGLILLDTSEGFAIPLFAKNPKQYVITSDVDFISILKNYKTDAEWIIMPDPSSGKSKRNIINKEYPDLWRGKLPSTEEYQHIDDWKIFRVVR